MAKASRDPIRQAAAADVDAYIAAAPKQAQAALKELRTAIKAAAPKAIECISYKMPFYKYNGKPLTAFAGYKTHVGLYAMPVKQFARELTGYIVGKGTVRFSLDQPLPVPLIKKLVKARLQSIKDD